MNMIKELGNAGLAAIADLRTDLVEAKAKEFSVPTFYSSAEELLNDDNIQGVILSLPANVRAALYQICR